MGSETTRRDVQSVRGGPWLLQRSPFCLWAPIIVVKSRAVKPAHAVLDAMDKDSGVRLTALKVDGGMVYNISAMRAISTCDGTFSQNFRRSPTCSMRAARSCSNARALPRTVYARESPAAARTW